MDYGNIYKLENIQNYKLFQVYFFNVIFSHFKIIKLKAKYFVYKLYEPVLFLNFSRELQTRIMSYLDSIKHIDVLKSL